MKIRVVQEDAGAPTRPGLTKSGHIYVGNKHFQSKEGEDAVYTPLFGENPQSELRSEDGYDGRYLPFLRIHPTEGLKLVWLDGIEMYEVMQPMAVDLILPKETKVLCKRRAV